MALYTVLPSKSDDDAADAMPILRGIIREPVNVVLLILGKPRRTERILEVAIGRAEAFPGTRRVVHAPDTSVLDQELLDAVKAAHTGTGTPVEAVFGLADRIAATLNAGAAKSRLQVELAFAEGEVQDIDEEPEP